MFGSFPSQKTSILNPVLSISKSQSLRSSSIHLLLHRSHILLFYRHLYFTGMVRSRLEDCLLETNQNWDHSLKNPSTVLPVVSNSIRKLFNGNFISKVHVLHPPCWGGHEYHIYKDSYLCLRQMFAMEGGHWLTVRPAICNANYWGLFSPAEHLLMCVPCLFVKPSRELLSRFPRCTWQHASNGLLISKWPFDRFLNSISVWPHEKQLQSLYESYFRVTFISQIGQLNRFWSSFIDMSQNSWTRHGRSLKNSRMIHSALRDSQFSTFLSCTSNNDYTN